MSRSTTAVLALLWCLLPGFVLSQEVVATGGVNVRAGRSASTAIRGHMEKGDTATLVTPKPSVGYFHVKTRDGITGYVWSARLAVVGGSSGEPAEPAGAATATISNGWQHTATNAADYTWPDTHGSCAAGGAGTPGHSDPETNLQKNRNDEPASYHDVTWDAIMALEVPRNSTKYRANWSASDKAVLAKYEGIPVRVVAFLSGAKNEGKESTNCGETDDAHVDWHLYMTKAPQRPKLEAIVIEATPRVRFLPQHSKWTFAAFDSLAKGSDSVRVSGWLMFDPEHWDQMYKYDPSNTSKANKYRATLWEIHPITKMEVFRGGKWVSLDKP